ncbi:protein white-like isoform X2 [Penaeus japonicus]|uniref:protein white-like isoform X2 n=1 Tax=Penaeus japonicus TaxID=27405 RepID=UPI001C70E726|nr:protein white-like isoform X2 [Penaeus japonicus]
MVKALTLELLKTQGKLYAGAWKEKNHEPAVMQPGSSHTSLDLAGEPDPITYSWRNVSVYYSRSTKAMDVPILRGVTGICRPGELLAIMGASGAGKTTLLNVLTHRNSDKLRISGDLFVNGLRVDPDALTSRSAYVQQDDLFIGTLTVREQLIFQALLRMDRHVTYEERVKRVNQVIMELGLVKCENTLIGVPGKAKSISGGEMKRLSFACEILTNPSLMFCDEPTSGLDSFMAQNVVAVMKNMAERGKTIISTIHQPSSEVFAMFDRVLLMAEGRVAFLGEVDAATKFLSSMDLHCPKQYNPSDYFIDQLSVQPGKELKCRQKIDMISDVFRSSSFNEEVKTAVLANEQQTGITFQKKDKDDERSPYKASWCKQFRTVTWRSWLEVVREPFLIRVRFFQIMAIAILVGVMYNRQQMDEVGVFNINGALFLLLTNMTFQNCSAVINTFCSQKHLFLREHYNGMYRTDVYFLAKNLVELPFFVTYSFLYASIIYWMIGLNPTLDRFLICGLVSVLVALAAVSFGYLLSCMANSVNMALTLLAPMTIPMMLFGGFFLNEKSAPVYMMWVKYLSWFNYGNEALMVNQWSGVKNLTCNGVKTCFADGEAVLTHLGYSEDDLWWDVTCLAVLVVVYRVIAFLFLLLRTHRGKTRS